MKPHDEAINNLIYKIGKAGKIKAEDLANVARIITEHLFIVSQESSISREVAKDHAHYYRALKINERARYQSLLETIAGREGILIKTDYEQDYDYHTTSTLIVLKTEGLL